jgi:acyl carrier protein
MAQHVTLIGAEDVSRAGYSMRDAASTMSSTASSIAHSLEMHQRFMDDWLARFTEAMQIASPAGEKIRSAQDEAMEVSPVTAQPAVGEASPSIAERVRTVIADHLVATGDRVDDTAGIINDLGADSLDLVEVVIALEEDFGIEIPDSDAEALLTVGDAIRYVEKAVR